MPQAPLRLGIAGVSHGHVKTVDRHQRPDIAVVGVYEADGDLLRAYGRQRGLDESILFTDLDAMIAATRPEAVAAFGSIADHLPVVVAAAPQGVHVMVEKPLVVLPKDAHRIAALARRHRISVLTNYETTWYPSTHLAAERVSAGEIGNVRKIVVHDGHRGPVEIGCAPEFLKWLTASGELGGGALIDFGCYGANLAVRLMRGAPERVIAVTGRFKPQIYPEVEDEATIILSYPQAQVVIQASWNWPISRKDMEVYGDRGAITAVDASTIRTEPAPGGAATTATVPPLAVPLDNPFTHLAAVVHGEHAPPDDDLSGLANNVLVVEILDAARRSARTGRAVKLSPS